MPAGVLDRQVGEILVHVEERRAGRMPFEVRASPAGRIQDVEAAVDEDGPH